MRVTLASTNANKARELERVVPGWAVEVLAGAEFPEETGTTFHENARAKAEVGRAVAGPDAWVVAEDSGLEVEGLGGRPGVHSARYGGAEASDADRIAKLLDELAGVRGPGRRARYVSELVCLSPHGEEFRARGTLEGTIADAPRGSEGFGYDPVFVPAGETATVAELGDAWKAEASHRARAARRLLEVLGTTAAAL